MTTIHGAAYDLEVVRIIRDRILGGDWTQDVAKDALGHRCLVGHIDDLGEYYVDGGACDAARDAVIAQAGHPILSIFNDQSTQAEVVALLDDVEDMLLGELA